MEMGKWRFILFQFTLIASFTISGCLDNQAPYKHLPHSETEIKVDKIITLDTGVTEERSEVKATEDKSDVKKENQEFSHLIKKLQREIEDLKHSRKKDRQRLSHMERKLKSYHDDSIVSSTELEHKLEGYHDVMQRKLEGYYGDIQGKMDGYHDNMDQKLFGFHGDIDRKLEDYHDEIIVSTAEVVQLRQLVTESYDRTKQFEETAKDFSVLTESYPYFEKEVTKELRRYTEYKERAAKRFHQIENNIKRLEKAREATLGSIGKTTQGYIDLQSELDTLRNFTHEIRENVSVSLSLLSACCNQPQPSQDNHNHLITHTHSKDKPTKGDYHNSGKLSNEIEITDFGSGDLHEYHMPISDLQAGKHVPGSTVEQIEEGSGETTQISEGSGETETVEGSGDATELPPFVDLSNYVHTTAFQMEIAVREMKIKSLTEQFQNLTNQISVLETRVTSIQLGDFMQRLQESFINFTQNVLTIDQFKMTSTQIVNSTIINQDSIVKLTNMILDNTDKIADLRWKVSNSELLSDQQFNILRMYVIRMNNSIEDIKEAMQKLEANKPYMSGHQSGFHGYHPGYGAQYPYPGRNYGENTQGNDRNFDTLSSKIDQLGLQIVYNQNRLGHLEVKYLNESLYTCRKYNIDSYQDSQLASIESMVKANLNSILMNHELLKQLDDAVADMDRGLNGNVRKIRSLSSNLNSFRGIIPAMLHMKTEVDNFMFQLPSDCSEYYQRGYRRSGVYVIHPITAKSSRQVTCHMDQDGGWTVIQQRFDGSLNFNRNWTEYRKGFGEPESEYWLGSDTIYQLTSEYKSSLRIEMTDIYGNVWTATYNEFNVSHPDDKFSLTVSGYHGNATDNMEYSSGFAFSTPDRDNDASGTHCAFFYKSGWWFKHCQLCNLNGRYDIGFMWFDLTTSSWIRLQSSVMKINSLHAT